MIETGEVRKRFSGPPEVTATLIHRARVLLGEVKNDMAFNGLDQAERTIRVPIGQIILGYSDSTERTIERRAEGIAIVKAISRNGQDTIEIDTRDVTITAIPPPEGEYIPYLWVGLRTESSRGPIDDPCGFEPSYNKANLYVFEPVTEEILAEIKASEDERLGLDYAATSVRFFSHRLLIGSLGGAFAATFAQEVPDELKTPVEVFHSKNNLYQVGHGVASLLSEGYPDTLWQKAVILDPDDPKKTTTETGSYSYANQTFPPHTVPGATEWQLKGKVVGGKYVVKVQMRGRDDSAADPTTYGGVAGPEQDVIIRVKVGKPPGRTETREYRIPFDKYQWSPYNRDVYPGGEDTEFTPEPTIYIDGPNSHGNSWWQGAFLVDVQNGTIQLIKDDVTLPAWGFDPTSHPTVKEIMWRWRLYSMNFFGGFGIFEELDGGLLQEDHRWRATLRFSRDHKTVPLSGDLWPEETDSVSVFGCSSGVTYQTSKYGPDETMRETGWIQQFPEPDWVALLGAPAGEPAVLYTAPDPSGQEQTFAPEFQLLEITDVSPYFVEPFAQECNGPTPTAQKIVLGCPRS